MARKKRRGTFQKCMSVRLKGRHFRTRRAGRIAFKKAVRFCKR